jgi:hypothetical protein
MSIQPQNPNMPMMHVPTGADAPCFSLLSEKVVIGVILLVICIAYQHFIGFGWMLAPPSAIGKGSLADENKETEILIRDDLNQTPSQTGPFKDLNAEIKMFLEEYTKIKLRKSDYKNEIILKKICRLRRVKHALFWNRMKDSSKEQAIKAEKALKQYLIDELYT